MLAAVFRHCELEAYLCRAYLEAYPCRNGNNMVPVTVGLDLNGRLDRWGLFCLSTVKSEASPSEFETRLYRNSDGWDCTDRGRSRVEIASERNRSQADREAAGCGKVTSSAISEPRPGDERITS